MKRGALLFVLILGILALVACAPKPEEVNVVVTKFWTHWTQWKANNPAGMVATMAAEVDFGIMASKGVPAMDLAEFLVSNITIGPSYTFSIITTELYDGYAVVEGAIDPNPTPGNEIEMTVHLRDTDDGWKVCLVALGIL